MNISEAAFNTLSAYARYLVASTGCYINAYAQLDRANLFVFETNNWKIWFQCVNNTFSVSYYVNDDVAPQLAFGLMLVKAIELRDTLNNAVKTSL